MRDLHAARSSAGLLHTSSLLNFYRNISVCYLKASSDTTKFSDLRGSLSTTVPSSSIELANSEVKLVIETKESSDRRIRGHRTYRRYLSRDVTEDYSRSYHCYSERIAIALYFSYAR